MAKANSERPSSEPAGTPAQAAGTPAQPAEGDVSSPRSASPEPLSTSSEPPGQAERAAAQVPPPQVPEPGPMPERRLQPAAAVDVPPTQVTEPPPETRGDLFPRSDAGPAEVLPKPAANPGGLVSELEAGRGQAAPASQETLSEVLSQGEVERLLSQVQAEDTNATVLRPGGRKTRLRNEDIQPCDFRQPAFLTSGELRKIRLRHEEFIRSLAARLSIYLRLEVVIHMSKLQTLSFQKYIDGLPNPTHLTQFKVEPLKGVCLLDMSPRLSMTFVDRLLGGPAHSVSLNGELSEIEAALLDQVAGLILNEWCALWQKIQNTRPVLLGHETNGRFLTSSAHDTVMLILSMEVRLGDCVEQMQLAFPFMTIEPLVRNSAQAADLQMDAASLRGQLKWNPGFDEVLVQLQAQWQGLELSARELTRLQCGDVLLLDTNCFDRVEIRFEQLAKFYGRLGTSGEHRAVQLSEPAKS
ncbi:MAG: FliM/FliN family flagellar motor switch protein [Verrucomicrobiota bacterium]